MRQKTWNLTWSVAIVAGPSHKLVEREDAMRKSSEVFSCETSQVHYNCNYVEIQIFLN